MKRGPGAQAAPSRKGSGAGEALPARVRAPAERSLGVSLSEVKLHRGSAEPERQGAIATSTGDRIHLARGAGDTVIAHELVHVAQGRVHGTAGASPVDRPGSPAEAEADRLAPAVARGAPVRVTRPRDARVHRKEPDKKGETKDDQVVIVPVGGNVGALGGYPALQALLTPADWNALSAGARRRSQTVAAGGKAPEAENEAVATELKVPLERLFRPKNAAKTTKTGGEEWMRDIYSAGVGGSGGTATMAARLQQEILGRWLETESGILSEEVTIALVDPQGAGGGSSQLLFSLRGTPIGTRDGSLMAADVDQALAGSLPGIVASMQGDVSRLESTINAASTAKRLLQGVKDFAARSDTDLAPNAFDEVDKALAGQIAALAGIKDAPFSTFVAPLASELKTYAQTDAAERRKKHQQWRADNPRKKTAYDMTIESIDACSDPDGFLEMLGCSYGAEQRYQYIGMSNMMTGGGADQVHQLGKSYDAGQISFNQYQDAADAVATRGLIFGGVMVALTVATLGLGMVALPAEAGLGSLIMFGVGTGIVTSAGPMIASNIYTDYRDLNDPAMQQWWKGTAYTGKDILIASAVGGGLGAAFPIAGKAFSAIMGKFAGAARPNIAGLLAAPPEGVVARSLGKDAVELAIAAEGTTIEVSTTGVKMFGPAGKNPKALLSSATWEEMTGAPLARDQPVDILHPRFPTSVNLSQRGWGVLSPKSARPVQFGLWDELALPGYGGTGQLANDVNPALLAGRGAAPLEGGGSMVFSGGTGPPLTRPMPPQLLALGAGEADPFAQMFPSFGKFPKALPPGPQPYGLLPEPLPQIDYLGPVSPSNMGDPLAMTAPVGRYGADILPPTAAGGKYIVTDQGIRYVAYPDSPGASGRVTTYGSGTKKDFRLDNSSGFKSFLIDPNASTYKGGRIWPMDPGDMRYGNIDLARSHGIPHADTKLVLPGRTLSTADAGDYVAHPRAYNERIRRTIEGRLRKEGEMWGAYNILGDQPRISQGGFVVPDAEIIVQFRPDGKIAKAWCFDFTNLNAYNNLGGNIDDILARAEINPALVPRGKLGR